MKATVLGSGLVVAVVLCPSLGMGTLRPTAACMRVESGEKRSVCVCVCPGLYLHMYSLASTHPPSENPLPSGVLWDCSVGHFSCSLLLYDEKGTIMLLLGACV